MFFLPWLDQTARSFRINSEGADSPAMNYWLYEPDATTDRDDAKWPLIIFLHGSGERGEDLELVKKWGPPKRVDKGGSVPFVVVSPQCPRGERWNVDHLEQLLDHVVAEEHVDPSRVYVTGLSMGGQGTWDLLAACPEKIAAAIPICGGGNPDVAARMIDVPIWAFHGQSDSVVDFELTRRMVAAILDAGGKKIKLTTYVGVDHNSWTPTYANPQIYEWFLSHRK